MNLLDISRCIMESYQWLALASFCEHWKEVEDLEGELCVGVVCLPGPRLQVSFVSDYPPSLILAPLQLSTLARLPFAQESLFSIGPAFCLRTQYEASKEPGTAV